MYGLASKWLFFINIFHEYVVTQKRKNVASNNVRNEKPKEKQNRFDREYG